MRALNAILRALIRSERGATAVEYGLIVALIVLAMIAALGNFGSVTTGMWNNVAREVEHAGG